MSNYSTLDDIRSVKRREKEEKTLYGVHNMESFNKIRSTYKYFLVKFINKTTIQVKKYSDDEELIMSFAGDNPDCAIMINGEIII